MAEKSIYARAKSAGVKPREACFFEKNIPGNPKVILNEARIYSIGRWA